MDKTPQVTAIILTFDEEKNLPDCLRSLQTLTQNIVIVDSGSTDSTLQIAEQYGCEIYSHPFDNYASSRNWAFDHVSINTPWVICLDADERLTPALADEIRHTIGLDLDVDGYMLCKRTVFMGKWIKHGGQYPSYHLRLFRRNKGRCESREYDQHFIVDGKINSLKNDYIDIIGNDLTKWTLRHLRWADMELRELTGQKQILGQVKPKFFGNAIQRKRYLRSNIYQKSPIFLRSFLFWIYVYFVRLGFLDGTQGLIFHTLRCFWFRFFVDSRIFETRNQGK